MVDHSFINIAFAGEKEEDSHHRVDIIHLYSMIRTHSLRQINYSKTAKIFYATRCICTWLYQSQLIEIYDKQIDHFSRTRFTVLVVPFEQIVIINVFFKNTGVFSQHFQESSWDCKSVLQKMLIENCYYLAYISSNYKVSKNFLKRKQRVFNEDTI